MDPNNTVHHSDKGWGLDPDLHLRTDDLPTDSKVWLTPLILFYDWVHANALSTDKGRNLNSYRNKCTCSINTGGL